MPSSTRRGGSGKGGGRGGGKPASFDGDDRPTTTSLGPTTATTTSVGGGRECGNTTPRIESYAKYRKPKIGQSFQCFVPKFVPPGGGGGPAGIGAENNNGDESGSYTSSSSSRTTPTKTRSVTGGKGGKGGQRGGARTRGKSGSRKGKGSGGGSRGGGGALASTLTASEMAAVASGETSAVDIANAAAEHVQDNYGSSLLAIPRGGLCVHRPLSHRAKTGKDEVQSFATSSSLLASSSSLENDHGGRVTLKSPPAPMDRQEDYLTFTRNVFLQTPRPLNETAIDKIWDGPTAKKFKANELIKSVRVRGKGKKRKAAAAASVDLIVEEDYHIGSMPFSRMNSTPGEDVAVSDKREKVSASNIEQSPNQAGEKLVQEEDTSELLPLCGLEDDEQALSYLQTNYHGDLQKAKLSIMVNSDRGYGVQRRRQLKKKRKEASEAYPDATTFSSESWRWRVHQARPTMLGDFRSSRDPTYPYFDPAPIKTNELMDTSHPWRLRRFSVDHTVEADEQQQPTRPRSFSISWSDEEIETAKKIWKSIFSYTTDILGKMEETRENTAKSALCDLLELVGKAHALPTPEEAFGRRDPSARQMSENMNSIIDAIEGGRDCVARILKCLKDDGEGIELDTLRKSIGDIEQSCPVGLAELATVKRQIEEATLWEEKLENSVDHGTADSNASDGENVITEKKLTLEKVEKLVTLGRNLTLRPRSLVRLQDRIERAHILRRRITVWNEARNQENPQNIKFISTLIKQANKIDLAFPELFTLTGVHKKAEEWMDRASIAVRTTISFEELESLVSVGESLPLNVSDLLEKLQNRLKQAQEWIMRLEEIVPKSEDHLMWLRRFRNALEDGEKNADLLSLLSEGSRIPVTMECSMMLQIEIDARHWSVKANLWIPPNLDTPGEVGVPQKRGKIADVKDHLDRASSLRDRLWFGETEKSEWVLDGESQLAKMIKMAESWLEKHNDVLNYDSRRNGKLCLPLIRLHTIVQEVNQIPLNIGNPSTKMNRIFSQADEWMKKYYPLLKRCGIECIYVPSCADPASDYSSKALKISELASAITDADSNVSVDLEEVLKMKEIFERAQIWMSQVNTIVSKKDSRKKGKQEKHSMKEISDLIDESQTIVVDITDELGRLQLEQSTTLSWRLQAQQNLRKITTAFDNFRRERNDVCSGAAESINSTSDALPTTATAGQTSIASNISGSMTTRNINSRRRALSNAGSSGSDTPAYTEKGGKYLFTLLSSFLKSVKAMNTITPEESVANELSEVMSWFTKAVKLINSPSDVYDRRNFSKLDKLIESGQKIVNADSTMVEDIPEDKKLVDDLRQSWAAAANDDIDRLLDLQNQRNKFVEWCEKADAIVLSTDKKLPIDTLKELLDQSASFPSSSEIVLRVRKRAKDSIAWVTSIAQIIQTGQKIPLDEAKVMADAGDKLNITCPEYKTLRAALRATKGWLSRVKKCGVANEQLQVAGNLVTELINEHKTFLVTAMDAFSELKQVLCGYCICRKPYEGFMIGCDGCDEWYHGSCVGISQEQAQKFDKYVCVRCSTLRVYKDNAAIVAGILRKWTSAKWLAKARSGDSQRYGRKVRSAERDIVKAKADLEKYERELNTLLGVASNALRETADFNAPSESQGPSPSVTSQTITTGKAAKSEKGLREKIAKAHTTIGNCEKRTEGYKVELVERKNLEAREDALSLNLKKWCAAVKQEVFSPVTEEKSELSRPRVDGSMSAPMDKAKQYAETLGIAKLPDIDAVLNSFKIFSWCLHSLGILMRKPRINEIRSLLSHSDSGYFKLPEAKCVRMLRSISSRAQIWQSKTKKALAPVPNEKKPYDLAVLRELLLAAKQIPLIMPEETRLWSTIEDGGNRHCICGGPSDGSFMLGCDNCDRWFHGSCMKIDKETGDALSKWICPPCSKSVSVEAVKVQEIHEIAGGETLLSQETNLPQSTQLPLSQSYHDISPHAPNPTTLWPPFGLRSSKESVEALGKAGESDNEDFEVPIQPVARLKSGPNSYSQNHVPQGASAVRSPMPNASHTGVKQEPKSYLQNPLPQGALAASSPMTNASHTGAKQEPKAYSPDHITKGTLSASSTKGNISQARVKSDSKAYPYDHVTQGALPASSTKGSVSHARVKSVSQTHLQSYVHNRALIASSNTASVSRFPLCQPIAAMNSRSVGYRQSNAPRIAPVAAAPSVSQASTYQTQAGNAQTATRVANKNPGHMSTSRPSHSGVLKKNHQPINSTQMPFSQNSSGTPFTPSSTVHHAASYHSQQTIAHPINSMSFNGSNLSVAVANMDHYVLSAADGANLHHPGVAMGTTAPLQTNSAMQMGAPNATQINGTKCPSYTTTAFPQTTPKAP